MDKYSILKKYFGHTTFRDGQERMIDALLAGRDALGIMPTGAGKSVCYQVPALLLPGVTLVISPLISLMKDQVSALLQSGIPAAYINSSLAPAQYFEVLRGARMGKYKLIYVAPERLTSESFLDFALNAAIPLVAVDEAHCVSQWGQDFRPSYLKISEFVSLMPRRPTLGAFTATATNDVRRDIRQLLTLNDPVSVITGFDRSNLYFDVLHTRGTRNKQALLFNLLAERSDRSGIIYCSTRKTVESLCDVLRDRGLTATRYHAGIPDEERRQNQEDFIYDRARIMVATNAFGMGIDKSNVSFVIHYNIPKNLESYYQEAGRAGRDGSPADCILLFSENDVMTAKYLIQNSDDNEELSDEERELVRAKDLLRLRRMTEYCRTPGCFRRFILGYFGESAPESCDYCGNCVGAAAANGIRTELRDITIPAQKILSCVARATRKYPYSFGVAFYAQILIGSRDQRIAELELDTLSTYGIMKEEGKSLVRDYIEHLISLGYLSASDDQYRIITLTDTASDILFRGKTVTMLMKLPMTPDEQQPEETIRRKKKRTDNNLVSPEDASLYEDLKKLRAHLAAMAGVPSYVVFTNATLAAMAAEKPTTHDELLEISGVGENKANRYGKKFIEVIQSYTE